MSACRDMLPLLFVVLIFFCATTNAAESKDIQFRCKVCERAIEYLWEQGVILRDHCHDSATDPRCDLSSIHRFAMEEMVQTICEDVPREYSLIKSQDSVDLIPRDNHETPTTNTEDDNEAITATCREWIFEEAGYDLVVRYMYANLEAGKPTVIILRSLKNLYCSKPCDPNFKRKRDAHDEL